MKIQTRISILALAAALFFGGCAGLSMQPEAMAALAAKQLIVSLPEAISFPQHFTLQKNSADAGATGPSSGLGSQMMEVLGNSSMEQRITKALDDSGVSLGRDCAEFFARELRGSGMFGGVNHSGGEAQFDVKVSEWGLAWDDVGGHYVPLLELDASLSLPVLGVVWRGHRNAADLSPAAKAHIYNLDPTRLIGQPQNLSGALEAVAADLAAQMVADLKAQAQIH